MKEEKTFSKSFYKASITLIVNLEEDIIGKENNKLIFSMTQKFLIKFYQNPSIHENYTSWENKIYPPNSRLIQHLKVNQSNQSGKWTTNKMP